LPAEIFANNAQGKLVGAIDAVTTTVVVTANSASYPFPSTGNFRILIDNEIILVQDVAVVGVTYTFTNCVRGVEAGTTPAAAATTHANGALVVQPYTADSIPQAIEDRIVQIAAGGQTASSGTVVFSNSNNVSFGLNGQTITASVELLVSGGTTSSAVSAITFSNANNVSFGFDGSNITASAGAAVGANINLSAGTTSNLSSAFTFGNANGVSFGLNAGTVTASVTVASTQASIKLSAGTTSNFGSAFTFSNTNGVSFGLNGSTITASVAPAVTVTAFSQDADFVTNFPVVQAGLSIQKLSIPMNLLATQLVLLAALSGFSNSSGALTVSHAVYSLIGNTANLASSASRVISFTSGSVTSASSQYGGASGTRYRTMSVSYALTPGDYLFGWCVSTANGITANVFGRAGLNIVGGFDGVETNYFLNGMSVSTTGAFPASIGAADTNYVRTGLSVMLQPGAILIGTH
jgi:hypothetical protein